MIDKEFIQTVGIRKILEDLIDSIAELNDGSGYVVELENNLKTTLERYERRHNYEHNYGIKNPCPK